jgi:hypothetical protein
VVERVLLGDDHLRLMEQALTAYALRHRVEEAEVWQGPDDVGAAEETGAAVEHELAFRLATRLLERRYHGLRLCVTGRT